MKKKAYVGVAKQKYGTSLKRRRPILVFVFVFFFFCRSKGV
jgi:hypothetical protein